MPALIEAHLVTGSERAKEKDGTLGDYVDQCANHLLLADGYSALAENEVLGSGGKVTAFGFDSKEEVYADARTASFERKGCALL